MARASSDRKLLKTGDVLKRSGVTRQMLYNYVAMGLLEEVKTTPAGHMLFNEKVFKRLALIQNLQISGYSLRDMKDIFGKRLSKDGDAAPVGD